MPWYSAKRRAAITEGGVQRTDSSPLLTPSSAKRPRLPKRWRTFSSSNLRSRSRTCAAFCHIRLRSRRSGFGAASERLECQSSQASCMTANAQAFDLNLPLRSSPSDTAASAPVVGAIRDEVIGPDMIALLRPQPDARSVGQPQPAPLGLLMGDLQPLALPDTLDPLVVDCPARLAQQFGDLAIAIAAVLPSKLDNIGGDALLRLTTPRRPAFGPAALSAAPPR